MAAACCVHAKGGQHAKLLSLSSPCLLLLLQEGTNLRTVLCLPEVDFRRVATNDIIETLEVLGIEACRQALLNEARNVLSFDGSYVNFRCVATHAHHAHPCAHALRCLWQAASRSHAPSRISCLLPLPYHCAAGTSRSWWTR